MIAVKVPHYSRCCWTTANDCAMFCSHVQWYFFMLEHTLWMKRAERLCSSEQRMDSNSTPFSSATISNSLAWYLQSRAEKIRHEATFRVINQVGKCLVCITAVDFFGSVSHFPQLTSCVRSFIMDTSADSLSQDEARHQEGEKRPVMRIWSGVNRRHQSNGK